jgi:hypothetical protein
MKISFAITVCNELTEIKKLLPFLLENKRVEDEIVILFDEKNGNEDVLKFLLDYNKLPNVQTYRGFSFNNDFAEWKNKLNSYCNGDYIFQLDADEMISDYLVKNVYEIVELNPEVDLFYVPRKNTVDGITEDHINKWRWRVNELGWINFPDFQGRIYKKGLQWFGKVHERITSGRMYSLLPTDDEIYFIYHHKTIEKQERQNNYYNTL